MKPLRTLLAALSFATSIFAGQASATLVGETIDGDAFIPGIPYSMGALLLDQSSATIGTGTEFTSLYGDFAAFDFADETLTITFSSSVERWLGWASYTFAGFEAQILSFDPIYSQGIDLNSDLLRPGGYSFTSDSVTVNFGDGWLLPGFHGENAQPAYVVFFIDPPQQVPEPQTYTLVLAALGLMGVNLRRRSGAPR